MVVNLMKQKLSVKAKSGHYLNEFTGDRVPIYWILQQQVMSNIYMTQAPY